MNKNCCTILNRIYSPIYMNQHKKHCYIWKTHTNIMFKKELKENIKIILLIYQ